MYINACIFTSSPSRAHNSAKLIISTMKRCLFGGKYEKQQVMYYKNKSVLLISFSREVNSKFGPLRVVSLTNSDEKMLFLGTLFVLLVFYAKLCFGVTRRRIRSWGSISLCIPYVVKATGFKGHLLHNCM